MASNIKDAESWRRLAAEARASAAKVSDPDARKELLEIAQRYELLASRAQRRQKEGKSG